MRRTGLVLAGGASRRFGEPKALASFDGVPMVRRVCDVLTSRCDEIIVSVGADVDPRRFETAAPWIRTVRDVQRDRGPIEGFRQGFAAARGEVVLVAPSDAPLLRPALYDGLLSLLDEHEAVLPRHEAMDPVRAVYRREAVLRVLQEGTVGSPSALVDRLDAAFLEGDALQAVDPLRLSFLDVNHRKDLDEALRIASLQP